MATADWRDDWQHSPHYAVAACACAGAGLLQKIPILTPLPFVGVSLTSAAVGLSDFQSPSTMVHRDVVEWSNPTLPPDGQNA